MIKRLFPLLLCLLLLNACAEAEDWLNDSSAPDAIEVVTDNTVYDAADAAGMVVNAENPTDPSQQQMIVYSFTPLDVVLIMDVSGSMERADGNTGKNLLAYAKEAANAFIHTLLSINPASRIGIVAFSDDAYVASGLKGVGDQVQLLSDVNSLYLMGRTNTGGAFADAAKLLNEQAMEGRRRMVVMLTDGLANEGIGDPITYAVQQGRTCAAMGYVYNIGLVGGLSNAEKRATRQVLNANYETRYFEVDFDDVADAGSLIMMITSSIAMSASSAETIDNSTGAIITNETFQLSIGPGFDARVESESGDCLSSFTEDRQDSATFGAMSQVDDSKNFVLMDGDYSIYIRGKYEADSYYILKSFRGENMQEETLVSMMDWSHESIAVRITLKDGKASVEDVGYHCLDVNAVDWDGNPVTGLEKAVMAKSKSNALIRCAPLQDAPKVYQLNACDHVQVLARSTDGDYAFVAFTDEAGMVSRGWMLYKALTQPYGYVPDMFWLNGQYTVLYDVESHRTPEALSSVAFKVKAGTQVTLLHAERSVDGSEWAYVSVRNEYNTRYAYVPVEALEGWRTLAPDNFRIGHNVLPYVTELEFPVIPVAPALKLAVFSGPNRSSWRGANRKALVNTNGGLRAMGWVDNGWLFVQYGTTIGNCRVGYIPADSIEADVPSVPLVNFNPIPAVISQDCLLTDDPLNFSEEIAQLKAGTKVTYLASYTYQATGTRLDYIETRVDNRVVRAFVPHGCLDK